MRPSWVRMGPTSNDKCPYKRKDMETHTWRRPYEGGGTETRFVAISQGALRIARGHQTPGERPGTDVFLGASEGTNPINTFVSEFWPPGHKSGYISVTLSHPACVACCGSPRKLRHHGNQLFCLPSFLFRKGAPQSQGPPLTHLCVPQAQLWTWCGNKHDVRLLATHRGPPRTA